eukprot:gnl/Spiro4/549_TR310_c0_g1_i1.p1 gnl/Spiro4/549_TR310_c0_g1~~gnl/Spiro4/549_TR310_c0_g1_i1.p1  ORF type:complete len:310 (-),score=43.28 gnl/Spiro4/549_TR310_c0_g1_i1:175-1104(-)
MQSSQQPDAKNDLHTLKVRRHITTPGKGAMNKPDLHEVALERIRAHPMVSPITKPNDGCPPPPPKMHPAVAKQRQTGINLFQPTATEAEVYKPRIPRVVPQPSPEIVNTRHSKAVAPNPPAREVRGLKLVPGRGNVESSSSADEPANQLPSKKRITAPGSNGQVLDVDIKPMKHYEPQNQFHPGPLNRAGSGANILAMHIRRDSRGRNDTSQTVNPTPLAAKIEHPTKRHIAERPQAAEPRQTGKAVGTRPQDSLRTEGGGLAAFAGTGVKVDSLGRPVPVPRVPAPPPRPATPSMFPEGHSRFGVVKH